MTPSNNLINPLAIRELFNTDGISLLSSARHLLEDLVHSGGIPSQMNRTAFETGRNLTTTQDTVTFCSEALELIQYKPLGKRQYAKPPLIVPPRINEYYTFDLSLKESFIQCILRNSLQIFVVN